MEIIGNNKYAICHKHNLFEGELPPKDGLAIESKSPKGNFVIVFIDYDEDDGVYMSPIGDRLLDVSAKDWPFVVELIRLASRMVEVANDDE